MSMLLPDHRQRNRFVVRIILSVVGALIVGSFLVGIRW
jgi:hypothetical protein